MSVGIELLEISVTVPEDLAATVSTRGLLGVFNNDQSDDFTTPNGTIVSINSTEEELFHSFGQKCKDKFIHVVLKLGHSYFRKTVLFEITLIRL